jgi:pyruvate-ferredoxin/flavodoxin oxidoreductase
MYPAIKEALAAEEAAHPVVARIKANADMLTEQSVWIVGGDGWAYDIGFGGLDHILAEGENVNIVVLDTEMYSNTGGQVSKATQLASSVKYQLAGKERPKKNLGKVAM